MKKRLLAILTAVLLCAVTMLAGCGPESADIGFTAAVDKISTPLSINSAVEINAAYDAYYALNEEDQRNTAQHKEKLDGYAEICNAITVFVGRADRIGGYTLYSKYNSEVGSALAAYNALIALDAGYAADSDVTAAKQSLDAAKATLDIKTALINAYVNSVNAITPYDNNSTLFSEWSALIAAAGTAYNAVSSKADDMRSLENVVTARQKLNSFLTAKSVLSLLVSDFIDKVGAAKEAYDSAFPTAEPVYNAAVNTLIDAADTAGAAAGAANLLSDAITEAARTVLSGLHSNYDGIRYTYLMTNAMDKIRLLIETPKQYDELSAEVAAAETAYDKLPAEDKTALADLKDELDGAKAKLPMIRAMKEFIDLAGAVNVGNAIRLSDLNAAVEAAEAKYAVLTGQFGYTSGNTQVDDAKAGFDAKKADYLLLKAFVDAVAALPAAMTNTADNFAKLTAAGAAYNQLTVLLKTAVLAVSSYTTYVLADNVFQSNLTGMFSAPAKFKDGAAVPAGMQLPDIDDESGAFLPGGALNNYLQVLYTVAGIKGGTLNGVGLDAGGTNVDNAAFDEYMAANFEYVYTIYDTLTQKSVGKITKALRYDEAAQIPAAAELKTLFPVYYNEAAERGYTYDMSIKVKTEAVDTDLRFQIRDSDTVRYDGSGTITGDTAHTDKLSPANLMSLESNKDNINLMRSGSVACAYTRSLRHEYVGAFDMYFYIGTGINDDNLIDWIRTVPETQKVGDYNHVANAYVRNFLGSSLMENSLENTILTDRGYMDAGVQDITVTMTGPTSANVLHRSHGWVISASAGYVNAWTQVSIIANVFRALGHDIPVGTTVTIAARLKANAAGIAAGITDSPFATLTVIF